MQLLVFGSPPDPIGRHSSAKRRHQPATDSGQCRPQHTWQRCGKGTLAPWAVQEVCLPVPPSLLWSLALLLVQAHLFLPARRKKKEIQHGAHLDVLKQRHYCYKPIKNTCLLDPGEHPLNQQLSAEQINDVYIDIS